jgi:hypothetical protein
MPIFSQATQETQEPPSALLQDLLSRDTSDDEWKAAEARFQELPGKDALGVLFPEIAKGPPGGFEYAAYNCFDPLKDRRVSGWGEFCVVHWLWCKELICPAKRNEVTNVLMELWSRPLSYYGQLALLQGLCVQPEAESRIFSLFRDRSADAGLRTEAAICLLNQDGTKYHHEAVALAKHSPPKLRGRLFDELASPPHRRASGIDPVVVKMGFALLLEEVHKQERARLNGQTVSEYGQFLYANRLNAYLGLSFEPDWKLPLYEGALGKERLYHDTVANALVWWSEHRGEYAD